MDHPGNSGGEHVFPFFLRALSCSKKSNACLSVCDKPTILILCFRLGLFSLITFLYMLSVDEDFL